MQVQLEKIPQFLKVHSQFCNWKYELRDGNQTKVPYMPGTTRRASVNDPATFTAFETAASATGYDGIGIRVSGRIVGIDLDHCMEDGKPIPWAQTIVERFGTTYIEISPSGEGIRIFSLLSDSFEYDITPFNAGKKKEEALSMLKKWFPQMENFSGQLKKYKVTINDLLAENEKLEARAKASEKGKMKDTMERAKLKSELDNMQRLVDRIPPEVLAELKRQPHYGKER